MSESLKPCPFCGSKKPYLTSEPDHPEYGSGGRYYFVVCPDCRCRSGSKYAHETCPLFYSEVRQEWSQRATQEGGK